MTLLIVEKRTVKQTGSQKAISHFFKPTTCAKEDKAAPYGIVILKQTASDTLSEIKIDNSDYLTVSPQIESVVKRCLKDLVVYGRNTLAVKCNVFDRIAPSLASRSSYVLKEYGVRVTTSAQAGPSSRPSTSSGKGTPPISFTDHSLSRCTASTSPFLPNVFKLSTPTPNAENACAGGVRINLEESASQAFPNLNIDDPEIPEVENACVLGIDYSVKRNYEPVVHDLQGKSENHEFDNGARNKAVELCQTLKDKNYFLFLHGFLDFLDFSSVLSKSLQQEAGVLMDKTHHIEKTKEQFNGFKNNRGAYVTSFLAEVKCPGVCDAEITFCNETQYEDCTEIHYHGIKLTDKDTTSPKFRTIYNDVLTSLTNQLDSYFDTELLTAVEILNLKKFHDTQISPGYIQKNMSFSQGSHRNEFNL
jgi:hypothetical protein